MILNEPRLGDCAFGSLMLLIASCCCFDENRLRFGKDIEVEIDAVEQRSRNFVLIFLDRVACAGTFFDV